ncbi:CsbD family protein [Cupriavidus sp. TMH.W2]|uniref:CsbD family protein n=1 Tax=Cupriavidus sp. TMH.W2 TaxID=3434465 RepID=UPI003D77195E
MNKSQIKGVGEKVRGKINEAVGKVRGDRAQAVKGKLQQGAGEARKQAGDAKEQVKKNNP